jgi:hypothetical protein
MRATWPPPPTPLSSAPPRQWHTDKCPLRHTSTQGRCHCDIAVAPCCVRKHSRRSTVEPSSPSLPPCAGPCCPHTMRGYKRRPLPFICPRAHRWLPPVSRPVLPHLCFHHFIGAKPPHPTSLPVRMSQSFTRAQSCSPTRRTGTYTTVELWRHQLCQ